MDKQAKQIQSALCYVQWTIPWTGLYHYVDCSMERSVNPKFGETVTNPPPPPPPMFLA